MIHCLAPRRSNLLGAFLQHIRVPSGRVRAHRSTAPSLAMGTWRVSLLGVTLVLALAVRRDAVAEPVASLETRTLQNIRQVTRAYEKAGEGYFSPDGERIVFQAVPFDYPFYQIFMQDLSRAVGGADDAVRVSTGRGRTTCSYFSIDGKKILFASSHLDPELNKTEEDARREAEEDRRTGRRRRYRWDFDPHMEIFELVGGGELRRLTDSPGYDAECAYSPDGKSIVFCSTRDGDPDLYIMNADGSDVRQLTNEDGYDGGPFFSPCGKWVVYRTDRKRPRYLQIHAIRVNGSDDTPLTDNVGVNWAPYWHPTKPYIIWGGADHSEPTGKFNYDLWLLEYADEGGPLRVVGEFRRLTDNPAADVLPVFSPDGKQLMWTSTRSSTGKSQLFIADWVDQ